MRQHLASAEVDFWRSEVAGGREGRKEGKRGTGGACVFRKAQAKVLTFGPRRREVAGVGTRRAPSPRGRQRGTGAERRMGRGRGAHLEARQSHKLAQTEIDEAPELKIYVYKKK